MPRDIVDEYEATGGEPNLSTGAAARLEVPEPFQRWVETLPAPARSRLSIHDLRQIWEPMRNVICAETARAEKAEAERYRKANNELRVATERYMQLHDQHGGSDPSTGRAWIELRRAIRASAALADEEGGE